jgi:general secretion pathway protein N
MRLPLLAALGAAAYAIFLVIEMPAAFIAARVAAAMPGVELIEPQGTLRHGAARIRVLAPGGHMLLDRVEWRWLPARLVSARIGFDIHAVGQGVDVRGELARAATHWEARNLSARVDAAALTPLSPLLAVWRPEGTLFVAAAAMDWDGEHARGDARVEWKDAALSLSEVRPLGSYRLDAHAADGPIGLKAATLGGALVVTAQGTLSSPSRMSLSGEARAQGPQAKSLEPLLDLIGPRRPDGARALEMRVN